MHIFPPLYFLFHTDRSWQTALVMIGTMAALTVLLVVAGKHFSK